MSVFQYTLHRAAHTPQVVPLELLNSQEIATPITGRDRAARSPFANYSRHLTAEGGILIAYKDIDRSTGYAFLRVFAWLVSTGIGSWGIISLGFGFLRTCGCMLALALINGLIVRKKFQVRHTVEIRPDGLIVDGADFFSLTDIGTNWPSLQMIDEDDPDRMVIAGICGTRWVEYSTANRIDASDRMPEVLAADLEDGMEQLWGRSELVFTAE